MSKVDLDVRISDIGIAVAEMNKLTGKAPQQLPKILKTILQ